MKSSFMEIPESRFMSSRQVNLVGADHSFRLSRWIGSRGLVLTSLETVIPNGGSASDAARRQPRADFRMVHVSRLRVILYLLLF